jgi:DNA-binding SARP family transcriptional activator
VRFAVLGPLEVSADGVVDLGGRRQRRLLGALLLHADRAVHADRLADIVFEGQPTAAAATTLRSYVARLRKALPDDGSGTSVVTEPPGYALELAGSTVDAIRFEDGLHAARRMDATDAGGRFRTLDQALAEWKGAAYAEFADEEWAHAESLRLEELRLTAEELRFAAQIDAGGHDAAAAGLLRFVAEHPLREAGWLSAMLALDRSGRQAKAIRAGNTYRAFLADIGLEPGIQFLDLEERIVVRDGRLLGRRSAEVRGYQIIGDSDEGRHGTAHLAIRPAPKRKVVESYESDTADHP